MGWARSRANCGTLGHAVHCETCISFYLVLSRARLESDVHHDVSTDVTKVRRRDAWPRGWVGGQNYETLKLRGETSTITDN